MLYLASGVLCVDSSENQLEEFGNFQKDVYKRQGYQWVEIEESERQEAQADLKMQAVRDMDKIVLLLDERYYYDEEGYLRAACFMKNGSSYVRKIFHRLNHAKESIALVVKNNEKVYNTLLDLL